MEQPRHAGYDDLAHVGGFPASLAPQVVYGIAHLGVHAALYCSTRESEVWLGHDDSRHPPVAIARMTAVAGFAMDSVAPPTIGAGATRPA